MLFKTGMNNPGYTSLKNFRFSYGLSIKPVINQALGVSLDLGFSREEDFLFYLDYGLIF